MDVWVGLTPKIVPEGRRPSCVAWRGPWTLTLVIGRPGKAYAIRAGSPSAAKQMILTRDYT